MGLCCEKSDMGLKNIKIFWHSELEMNKEILYWLWSQSDALLLLVTT